MGHLSGFSPSPVQPQTSQTWISLVCTSAPPSSAAFGLTVQSGVDLLRFQCPSGGAHGTLFTLQFGHASEGGIHLLNFVGLAVDGRLQVAGRGVYAVQSLEVVGSMDLFGEGDGLEEPGHVGAPVVFCLLCEDEIPRVSLALARECCL
jgi:hypothetical protein